MHADFKLQISAFQNIRGNQEISNAISREFLFSTYYPGIKKKM